MITLDNYIIEVRPENGETYIFSYETPDVWTALEEFWHEDWDDHLSGLPMNTAWPMDVYAMDMGKVVKTYKFKFCTSSFHGFFDHGRCTLDEFAKYIERHDKTYGMTIQMVCDRIAEFTGEKKKDAMRKARIFRKNCCVPMTKVEDIRLAFGKFGDDHGNYYGVNRDTLHFCYKDSDGEQHMFTIMD